MRQLDSFLASEMGSMFASRLNERGENVKCFQGGDDVHMGSSYTCQVHESRQLEVVILKETYYADFWVHIFVWGI